MARFEQELSGALGAYWKASAEKELEQIKADLEAGKITIDGDGVARNCIGRVLMDDMLEKLAKVTDQADTAATRAARAAEVQKELRAYRERSAAPTEEELQEMRAAFGTGETVVNVLTGEKTEL